MASVYVDKHDDKAALPFLQEALAITERLNGPQHPLTAEAMHNVAWPLYRLEDYEGAFKLFDKATSIHIAHAEEASAASGPDRATARSVSRADTFLARIEVSHVIGEKDKARQAALLRETYELARWANSSQSANALALMAARFGTSGTSHGTDLASRVRTQQNMFEERAALNKQLSAELSLPPGKRSAGREQVLSARIEELGNKLAASSSEIANAYPEYAALVNPKPVSVAATQQELKDDEALVQVVTGQFESFVWVVTRKDANWRKVELPLNEAEAMVRTLRCGLDDIGEWVYDPPKWIAVHGYCKELEQARNETAEPPFQFDVAHKLYAKLLAPFEKQIAGKQLSAVISGPLATLPLHVFLTAPPDPDLHGVDRYKKASWLGTRQSIVTLPTVASLHVLRGLRKQLSPAPKVYIGIGNPLLKGDPTDDEDVKRAKLASAYKNCKLVPPLRLAARRPQRSWSNSIASWLRPSPKKMPASCRRYSSISASSAPRIFSSTAIALFRNSSASLNLPATWNITEMLL